MESHGAKNSDVLITSGFHADSVDCVSTVEESQFNRNTVVVYVVYGACLFNSSNKIWLNCIHISLI